VERVESKPSNPKPPQVLVDDGTDKPVDQISELPAVEYTPNAAAGSPQVTASANAFANPKTATKASSPQRLGLLRQNAYAGAAARGERLLHVPDAPDGANGNTAGAAPTTNAVVELWMLLLLHMPRSRGSACRTPRP